MRHVRGQLSRISLLLGASLLLLAFTSSGARANILVYENSEAAPFLGEVHKMKCKVKRFSNGNRIFRAAGKTINGAYSLDIGLLDFRGFGKSYNLAYGSQRTSVDFEGVANPSDFSNVFPFPGTPPPSAGTILFGRRGAKVGVGAYAIPNQDYSRGIALAGAAKCVYPR